MMGEKQRVDVRNLGGDNEKYGGFVGPTRGDVEQAWSSDYHCFPFLLQDPTELVLDRAFRMRKGAQMNHQKE